MRRTSTLVAPLAGAWIESPKLPQYQFTTEVAPLAGAWIESHLVEFGTMERIVAPLAGAWIESSRGSGRRAACSSRAPRGRVD